MLLVYYCFLPAAAYLLLQAKVVRVVEQFFLPCVEGWLDLPVHFRL